MAETLSDSEVYDSFTVDDERREPQVSFSLRLPPAVRERIKIYWQRRYPGLPKGTPARLIMEMGLREAERVVGTQTC